MTDKEKAQVIGEIVLELNRVNQELSCYKAKAARIGETLENISNHLKRWGDPVRSYSQLPDAEMSVEGMDPQGIVERIHVLSRKRTELNDRLKGMGVG